MASLTQRVTGVADGLGHVCTVDVIYDSVTFTVLTLLITNGWGSAYNCKITNTGTAQSFSETANPGATLSVAPLLTWVLNSDASLQNGWTFQG